MCDVIVRLIAHMPDNDSQSNLLFTPAARIPMHKSIWMVNLVSVMPKVVFISIFIYTKLDFYSDFVKLDFYSDFVQIWVFYSFLVR
jgi:hypothetical protein